MSRFRIAAAQYPIDRLPSFDAWCHKISQWCERAAGTDAELLVFPEYAGMELAGLLDDAEAGDLRASIRGMQAYIADACLHHAHLARQYGVHILQGSLPVEVNGQFVNRAFLHAPSGRSGHQDKQIMTRFERESWNIVGNGPLRVFETAIGRIGILICYDSEFPLLARALCEAGATILLVPSCTETEAGYWRVRIGSQARALENQCITIQSPTVGTASWSPAVDTNFGAAAVYGPPDSGWPPTGVIASGVANECCWVMSEVDLSLIERTRADGMVLNHRDWSEQTPDGGLVRINVDLQDLR
ncbi:MAG: carbon-nitrogen hydrolase family protein [Geminicoccaceae bacterium]